MKRITTYYVESWSRTTRTWIQVPETYGSLAFAQEAFAKLRVQGFKVRIRKGV